ncbi:hypothetical protein H2201_008027 [Coniosporium apollinis]|uniref:Uncharacterized protein n=1 Tax=Coniosporium apollinis TaxID=61459 RepID=A0ABQ9NHL9_9PEZI|nr:hypothetical protein H2201_008027 [Coniosporium apollinis]
MTAYQDLSWDWRTVEIAGNIHNYDSFCFHDDPRIEGWAKITHSEGLVAIEEFFSESSSYEVQTPGQLQPDKAPEEESHNLFYESLSHISIRNEENSVESLLVVSQGLPASPASITEALEQSPPVAECTEEGSLPTDLGGYEGEPLIPSPQPTSRSSSVTDRPSESDKEASQVDQDTLMKDLTIDQYVPTETLAADASPASSDAKARIQDAYEGPLVTSSVQTPQLALPQEASGGTFGLSILNLSLPGQENGVQTPPPEAAQPASDVPDDSMIAPEAPQTSRRSVGDNDALTPCTTRTSISSPSKAEQDAALKLSSEPLGWRGFDIHADAVAVVAIGQRSSEQLVSEASESDSVRSPQIRNPAPNSPQSHSPTAMGELHSFERVLEPPTFKEIPALRRSPNPSPEKSTMPVSLSRLQSPEDVWRSGGRPRNDGSVNVRPPKYPSVRKTPERYLHGQYPMKVYKAAVECNDFGNLMDADEAGGGDTSNYQDVNEEPTDSLSLRSYEATKSLNNITDTSLFFPEQANAELIKGRNNHIEENENPKKLMQQEADPSQEELRLADALDYGSPAAWSTFTSSQNNIPSHIGPQIPQAYHPFRSQPPIVFSPLPVLPSQRHPVGHYAHNAATSGGHGVDVPRPPALLPVSGPTPSPIATAAPWFHGDPDPIQIRNLMQLLASYSQPAAAVALGQTPPPLPRNLPWFNPVYSSPIQHPGQQNVRTAAQGHGNAWLPEAQVRQAHQTWRHPINPFDSSQIYPLLPPAMDSPVAPTVSPITPYVATAPFPDIPITQSGILVTSGAESQLHMGYGLPIHDTQPSNTLPPSASPVPNPPTPGLRTKRRASSPAGPQPTPKTRAAPGNRMGVLYSTGTPPAAVSELCDATAAQVSPSSIRSHTPDGEIFYDADESFLSDAKMVAPASDLPVRKQADEKSGGRDDGVQLGIRVQKSASNRAGSLPVSSPLSDVPSSVGNMGIRTAITDATGSPSPAVGSNQPNTEKPLQATGARGRGSGRGRGRVTKPTAAAGGGRSQAGHGRGLDTATSTAGRRVPPVLPAVAVTPPSRARSGVLSPAQIDSGASQRRGWETRRANAMRKKVQATVGGDGTPAALRKSGAEADSDISGAQSGAQTKPKGRSGKKVTATSKLAKANVKKSGADTEQDESIAEPAKKKQRRSARQSARLSEGPGLAEGTPGA